MKVIEYITTCVGVVSETNMSNIGHTSNIKCRCYKACKTRRFLFNKQILVLITLCECGCEECMINEYLSMVR